MFLRTIPLLVVILAIGCQPPPGPPKTDADPQDQGSLAEGKKFVLPSEPARARGVIEVKKQAKDGDEVVIVGRVGGTAKPLTRGRASFLIVDPSLKPSWECDCPWDYCDSRVEDLAAARANVKFVGADGKTLPIGAKELFGIKELTTVVVKGKANRDKEGNLTVVGDGIFVRPDKE